MYFNHGLSLAVVLANNLLGISDSKGDYLSLIYTKVYWVRLKFPTILCSKIRIPWEKEHWCTNKKCKECSDNNVYTFGGGGMKIAISWIPHDQWACYLPSIWLFAQKHKRLTTKKIIMPCINGPLSLESTVKDEFNVQKDGNRESISRPRHHNGCNMIGIAAAKAHDEQSHQYNLLRLTRRVPQISFLHQDADWLLRVQQP